MVVYYRRFLLFMEEVAAKMKFRIAVIMTAVHEQFWEMEYVMANSNFTAVI